MIKTNKGRRFLVKRALVSICAFLLITVGLYVIYIGYIAPPRDQRGISTQASVKPGVDGTKKTPEQHAAYAVPADHPKNLIIDSLGVNANVLPMGTLNDGALDAPKTAWDVGWYEKSALPGTNDGALLIDGHVNDRLGKPGVFYGIDSLKSGDDLSIERGDGAMYTYSVVRVEQKPLADVDMAKMQRSITPGKEGLNLITCGGEYDDARGSYDDRVLVYAVRVDV
jgi:LPXTG-site transpeptidase (sortase) family protein